MRAEIALGQDHDHAPYGGVVPEIAARAHVERMDWAIEKVMSEAGVHYAALDGVAATAGPGLVGGVMVALSTAKGMALATGAPLIAVNHLEAHVLSPVLEQSMAFPYLTLLVSGGHTLLVLAEDVGRYRRLGASRDDAAGEAFDKTAKIMGLGHPGGPAVEAAARQGDPNRFALPKPFMGTDHCDFSFAGLKTAALRAWTASDRSDQARADLSAGVQEAIAAVLADRTERALAIAAQHGARSLAVVGGVAANAAIRDKLSQLCQHCGVAMIAPRPRWCTDNAAMVAAAGLERLARGMVDDLAVSARARWPLDEQLAATAPVLGSGRKGPKA